VTGVALTTNGGIASSGTTSLTGAAYLDGTTAITGAATASGGLTSSGVTSITGALTTGSTVAMTGAITASGGITSSGVTSITGAAYLDAATTMAGLTSTALITGTGIQASATITGATMYAAAAQLTSDRRFKQNFEAVRGLEIINNLRGVSYTWRQDDFPERNFDNSTHQGFIAQEVEKVLPRVVSTGLDGYKSINYNEIIPSLVEGMKEQTILIEEQRKQLEEALELVRIQRREFEQLEERVSQALRIFAI
jgi:hypothetical protein